MCSHEAVILCTAGVLCRGRALWTNSEMFANGFKSDPRNTGDGLAMAWRAGAEMNSEEQFGHALSVSPFGWPWYGIGNADNTWHGCTIVDNNGKEVPWVDGLMSPIDTVEERWLPGKDQAFMGFMRPIPLFDKTLIESGEYELPFWADLSALPEHERRGIWGLMVGNEGRTRIAIYNYYNKAGFNPETDMLQCPVMTPESFTNRRKDWFQGGRTWPEPRRTPSGALPWTANRRTCPACLPPARRRSAGATAGAAGAYAGNRAAEFAMEAERIRWTRRR